MTALLCRLLGHRWLPLYGETLDYLCRRCLARHAVTRAVR